MALMWRGVRTSWVVTWVRTGCRTRKACSVEWWFKGSKHAGRTKKRAFASQPLLPQNCMISSVNFTSDMRVKT